MLLTLAAGCSASAPVDRDHAALAPVRLAIINPQTGDFSPLGKWEHKGVKLAVDEANATGGVNGHRIELAVFDDQGDPAKAATLAEQVGQAGYSAVFGSALSGNTLAMAPVLDRLHLPAITSGQAPSLAARNDPYLFLNSTTSTTFDETLAAYVVGKANLTSIALITNDGAYGTRRAGGVHGRPGQPRNHARGRPGGGGRPEGLRLRPDLDQAAQRQSPFHRRRGAAERADRCRRPGRSASPSTLIGAAPMGTDVYLNTAGAEAAEGSVFSTPYPTNDENDATRAFAAAYQVAFGEVPEFHAAKAYDGARIVIAALRSSDNATGLALAQAIRSTHFTGLLGSFVFDASGVGIQRTRVATIKAGRVIALTA